jgi:predicted NBD/HSP70 family sugar kinase
VRLSRPDGVVLGVDLGHAHVTVAVATTGGDLLVERSADLDVDHRPHPALDLAASLATAALADAGRPAEDVRAVAAGIPGPIDVRTRVVRAPTILVDWVGIDPAAELAGRLGRPAVVGNDADMGAIGEYTFGAARGFADFLYIKASHGVGAGIVLGGRTYRGTTGIAGEIGHTQLPGATSWCRCGSRGCLETVASISEVREQLAHVLTTANEPTAAATLPPLPELVGNPAAARVITDAGRTIGRVVADLVNCLNPAAVVLGGELGAAGKPFVNGVRESIDRYAQPAAAQAVRTLPAELGARAELMGTVATAIRSLAGSVPA